MNACLVLQHALQPVQLYRSQPIIHTFIRHGSGLACASGMHLVRDCAQGYYEGQLAQLTKRHQQRQRRRKGPDERTVITGQRLPEPGNPPASCSQAQLAQTSNRAYVNV